MLFYATWTQQVLTMYKVSGCLHFSQVQIWLFSKVTSLSVWRNLHPHMLGDIPSGKEERDNRWLWVDGCPPSPYTTREREIMSCILTFPACCGQAFLSGGASRTVHSSLLLSGECWWASICERQPGGGEPPNTPLTPHCSQGKGVAV